MPMAPIADPDFLQPQPAGHALALPARCYTDPAFEALDRRAVFARSWQLVGHQAQFRAPGDHRLVEVAGLPLVLLQDAQGALRALHNVCRHRGGPLVMGDGSGLTQLRCRYHGWRYGLDGALVGAPGMGRVEGFDRAQVCLPSARVAQWQGLIFVCLDDAAPPFSAVVAGIDARLGSQTLDGWAFQRQVVYRVDCDWKLYIDNYLEGYHLAEVHPGLSSVLDTASYRTEVARWHSLQSSPIDSADGLYGRGEALYCFLYPNTMLNILPDRLQTNRVLPDGPGRCVVVFDYYQPPGLPDAPTRLAQDIAFSDQVQAEDAAICAAVQRGMASGSYRPGRLHPVQEQALAHFQNLLREAWRDEAIGSADLPLNPPSRPSP